MSTIVTSNQPFVRDTLVGVLPPPRSEVGAIAWMRSNLFSGPVNSLLTVAGFSLLAFIIWHLVGFLLIRAVWTGDSREACLGSDVGACWPFIKAKFGQFVYGFYPVEERWRPNVVFALGALLVVPLLALAAPRKQHETVNADGQPIDPLILAALDRKAALQARIKMILAVLFFVVYPVVSFFLLQGDVFGLPLVSTRIWGGILVTLVVSVVGIVVSLPLGIILALGRRSKLPIIRFASVAFIEFWRGVPLITVLFFATYMLPLFLPRGTEFNGLLRALVGVSLFAAAYMAEVVRGGLQAIPRGQYEGAMAVGLGYWQMSFLIVLPQALKLVIPGIVNTFIGLFKDTTLVLIVSILDLLGQLRAAFADPNWATPVTEFTGYAFAGFFYFFFCYGMSRYSRFVEQRLNTGHKR